MIDEAAKYHFRPANKKPEDNKFKNSQFDVLLNYILPDDSRQAAFIISLMLEKAARKVSR